MVGVAGMAVVAGVDGVVGVIGVVGVAGVQARAPACSARVTACDAAGPVFYDGTEGARRSCTSRVRNRTLDPGRITYDDDSRTCDDRTLWA